MLPNAAAQQTRVIPPVVLPLVRRHVEDAAFYWQQIDASTSSTRLTWARLRHFDRMLDANLEGAYRAGDVGMQIAIDALGRWRTAGEVFVAAALALRSDDDNVMASVLNVVRESPDSTARGLISALGRTQTTKSNALIQHWLQESDPVLRMAALRIMALRQPVLDAAVLSVQQCLDDGSSHVRAAACRAMSGLDAQSALLSPRLQDEDLAVRAEAAIALRDPDVLRRCITEQASVMLLATGWHRKQSQRRLRRWSHQMAWVLPWPIETDSDWLCALPGKVALDYVAHRGDVRLEPWLLQMMEQAPFPRHAGWAWQVLRGVDIESEGLAVSDVAFDPEQDDVVAVAEDEAGAAIPDAQAVRAWVGRHGSAWHGDRVILGQPWSTTLLREIIDEGAQVYRLMASQAMRYQAGLAALNVRASARDQDMATERLRRSGHHESI